MIRQFSSELYVNSMTQRLTKTRDFNSQDVTVFTAWGSGHSGWGAQNYGENCKCVCTELIFHCGKKCISSLCVGIFFPCSCSETKTRSKTRWRRWRAATRISGGNWRRECEAQLIFETLNVLNNQAWWSSSCQPKHFPAFPRIHLLFCCCRCCGAAAAFALACDVVSLLVPLMWLRLDFHRFLLVVGPCDGSSEWRWMRSSGRSRGPCTNASRK